MPDELVCNYLLERLGQVGRAGADGRNLGDQTRPQEFPFGVGAGILHRQHGSAHALQRTACRRRLGQRRPQPRHCRGVIAEDDVLFGREVAENGPRRDARRRRDLLDRRRLESPLGKEREGRRDDLVAGPCSVAVAERRSLIHGR